MSKQLAKLVNVEASGKPLAGLTNIDFNGNTEFATSETKADKGPIDTPDSLTWDMSVSGVLGRENGSSLLQVSDLKALIKAGDEVPVKLVIGTLASYQGKALVQSFSIDMPDGGDITYSGTFKGNSDLSKVATTSV